MALGTGLSGTGGHMIFMFQKFGAKEFSLPLKETLLLKGSPLICPICSLMQVVTFFAFRN
jgi:hypothetical protein